MLRLMSEIEGSVSLLPAVVGSTNLQAEIALALQPLRSENAQLRRWGLLSEPVLTARAPKASLTGLV